MKHILNVLRFILFFPICLGALWAVYWLLGVTVEWIADLSWFWLILIFLLGGGVLIGLWAYASVFIAKMAMKITPYKKVSAVIMTILIVIISLFQIFIIWKIGDYTQTKMFIVLLVTTGAIGYIGFGFIGGLFLGDENE